MNILFIGDIFGAVGRRVLADKLSKIIEQHAVDVCIANGENAAGGCGCTTNIAKKLRKYGVNVITGGNHSFSNTDALASFESDSNFLRPLNFPPGNPGIGKTIFEISYGNKIGVINLQGRTFSPQTIDCPFRAGHEACVELRKETPVIIVDFHAEASSEKSAFAQYVDGKVSAVIGTHTHVQTADERILKRGTAYITDVGMTGPEQSVIGMKTNNVIQRFLLQTPIRFEPSKDGPMLNAVVVQVDEHNGKAQSIRRIFQRINFS